MTTTVITRDSNPVQPPRAVLLRTHAANELLQQAAMLEAQALEAEAEAREILEYIWTLDAFDDTTEIDSCSLRRIDLAVEASNARTAAMACRLRAEAMRGGL